MLRANIQFWYIGPCTKSCPLCGAVAHPGERFNGIEEVGSSSLPSSTIAASDAQTECYYADGFVVKWIGKFSISDKLVEYLRQTVRS